MAHVEREVKLGAWPGLALPDLTGVVPGGSVLALQPQRLTATYHDTADLRLARWGITVRHRRADVDGADGHEEWTVKLPGTTEGPGLVRTEHSFTGAEHRVPADARHLLGGYIRSATLVPVARLQTARLRLEVRDADGEPLVEIDDDEVSVLVTGPGRRSRRVAARFREIEVELVTGAQTKILEEIVRCLQAAGAGPADPTPKVMRALGPAALLPAEVVVPPVGPGSNAADVVQAAIASGVVRLLAHDPGVRLGDDPEDVHQARVATRRLRSDLRTFRPLLDPDWTAAVRDELGWIAALLGGVRDTDVLLERLRRQAAALSPTDAKAAVSLLRRLEAQRNDARAALLEAFDSHRYIELLDGLVTAAAAPPLALAAGGADATTEPAPGHVPLPLQPAKDVVPELVQRPWRHLARAVGELGDAPEDTSLHHVRVLAKRCRYAAEAAVPVAGKDARRLAEAVADVQGVLGDFNDAVVAEAWLRGAAARGPAVLAVAAGQLIAANRVEAEAGRQAWARAWKKASSKRLRDWLG